MGGKTGGGGLGGMFGGGGGAGGKGPMTAEQADAANQTRRQNLFTTVGGLSRPGGANIPSPKIRPSGPSGPPAKAGAAGAGGPPPPRQRPTLDPKLLDPLITGQPLTGTAGALGEGTTGFGPPGSPGVGYPEGFASSPITSLRDPSLELDPTTGRMRPKTKVTRRLGSTDPALYAPYVRT